MIHGAPRDTCHPYTRTGRDVASTPPRRPREVGLRGDDEPRAATGAPARADAERTGTLLLLVEDHPVNREIVAGQLEAIGFATGCEPFEAGGGAS